MALLNPSLLLWLVPLVALPLAVHLLNRKFPKTFEFPSIELIKKSVAQRSRLFRWRHILLALLRTAALLLLLIAFLRPIREMFGSRQAVTGARHVLILFDHSLSMEARDGSLTGRQRGVLEVEKIINTLGPDDLLNVRVVGRDAPGCFMEFSREHSNALQFLKALEPGLGRADFNAAHAIAAQDFSKEQGRREVYYISDFQRKTWSDVDLEKAPPSARLFYVNVAPGQRMNHAILGAEIAQGSVTAGSSVPLEVNVGNFADTPFSGEIEVIVDDKRSFKADATVAPWSVSKTTLPIHLGSTGNKSITIRLPEDSLPQDDHFFLTPRVTEKEEVLVVSDETGGKQQSAGFFLVKAINPYENMAGSLLPKPLNSGRLTEGELGTTRKLFLTNLDRLDRQKADILIKFISGGGNIVYFCDGKADAENLALLDEAAGGEFIPLKLSTRQEVSNLAAGTQQIIRGDFKSKYLRLFRGSQRQNLALLEFYEYYHALSTGNGNILLTYADEVPAMASSYTGQGTLLICNFSVNELSSNMARQRLFPAWIHDLVKVLDADDSAAQSYEAGDIVHTEMWESELQNNAVTAPGGATVRTQRDLDNGRYRLSFLAEEQGIYRLGKGEGSFTFAVNTSADESDLRAVDMARFDQKQQGHVVEGEGDFKALNTGAPLFHYFIFGVLLLMVAELLAMTLFKRLTA